MAPFAALPFALPTVLDLALLCPLTLSQLTYLDARGYTQAQGGAQGGAGGEGCGQGRLHRFPLS